ncbi:MAG: putrescine aminotransferase [Cyanobacteriota bacterium erpe_2018_sw_21hr_WHONDRS-SW48-000092_B_bin.40]|jgi:putrescine aminotransferase|nr:putrescine aminotransferase [Cyanobacteriota bacterium erpe_2018_sw_21hr_WHONDRS-SW48-000092_B_bin.40]
MAVYKNETQTKQFPLVERNSNHYQEIASSALSNSINHLNNAYSQKLSGAEGAVEFRDEGVYTYDNKGRRYLDCLGGYGIFNVGHRHPRVIEAVKMQLDQVCLHSQELINPWSAHLASQLAAITPGDLQYSFFCNSGSEAVEGAIKLARLYTGKTEIISTKNAYHGVSMGALSATGRDVFRKPFAPLLNGFSHVEFGNIEAMEAAINENTAAVILEPIQGEGGINVPSEGYLRKVRQLTEKHGILLILDEVQTGMGRTGRMFACEHESVVPDILCLAKALGGGVMPIGCFMASAKIWKVLEPNPTIHNSTFGGNPLACSAASACIEVLLDEHLPARAALMGNYFMRKLNELKERYPERIFDVRGKGLLIGLEFTSKDLREAVQVELFHRGVIVASTLNSNCTFRIEPPLIITESQINFMIDALESVLIDIGSGRLAEMQALAEAQELEEQKLIQQDLAALEPLSISEVLSDSEADMIIDEISVAKARLRRRVRAAAGATAKKTSSKVAGARRVCEPRLVPVRESRTKSNSQSNLDSAKKKVAKPNKTGKKKSAGKKDKPKSKASYRAKARN